MKRLPFGEVEHLVARAADGCWNWTGAINSSGYGNVNRDGRTYMAHRYVYESHRGAIPEGLTLDHLCRNIQCVNPEHMEPVTVAENLRRAAAVRTTCKAGHEYTSENTRVHSPRPGWFKRDCRECDRARARAYRLRKGAA